MKLKRHTEEDFELNLAPVIDCLTVLVTFLLASASFLNVTVIDAGFGTSSESAQQDATNQEVAQIELNAQHQIALKIVQTQGSKELDSLRIESREGSEFDFEALNQAIDKEKGKFPGVQSLILSAADEIPYQDVVKTMDQMRGKVPNLILGGF